jgi:hypothetical protein
MASPTEKKLSKGGFRVYFAVVVVALLYFCWGMGMNTGLASWLIKVQMQMGGDNKYSPVLTMLVLSLPAQAIAFPAGFLYDYMTKQGIFARAATEAPAPEYVRETGRPG